MFKCNAQSSPLNGSIHSNSSYLLFKWLSNTDYVNTARHYYYSIYLIQTIKMFTK